MSRDSPQPECLSDTMDQTRAKRARIQSQKPLSPESALNPPSPLKEPLEVSVPTTSGFRLKNFTIFFFFSNTTLNVKTTASLLSYIFVNIEEKASRFT